jgi:hypothetical protein
MNRNESKEGALRELFMGLSIVPMTDIKLANIRQQVYNFFYFNDLTDVQYLLNFDDKIGKLTIQGLRLSDQIVITHLMKTT